MREVEPEKTGEAEHDDAGTWRGQEGDDARARPFAQRSVHGIQRGCFVARSAAPLARSCLRCRSLAQPPRRGAAAGHASLRVLGRGRVALCSQLAIACALKRGAGPCVGCVGCEDKAAGCESSYTAFPLSRPFFCFLSSSFWSCMQAPQRCGREGGPSPKGPPSVYLGCTRFASRAPSVFLSFFLSVSFLLFSRENSVEIVKFWALSRV